MYVEVIGHPQVANHCFFFYETWSLCGPELTKQTKLCPTNNPKIDLCLLPQH